MTKITYTEALNIALSANLPEEVKDKLTALREQIAKRNNAERKPTKAQKANQELAEVVFEVLRGATEPLTVTEIMAQDKTLSTLSNQKVSALVNSLVEAGRATKITDKRKSYFERV